MGLNACQIATRNNVIVVYGPRDRLGLKQSYHLYSFYTIKECNFNFLDKLVEEWKYSNILIYLPNAVSFAMQIRFDHLIRKVIWSIF
jgi:hypothetical protein